MLADAASEAAAGRMLMSKKKFLLLLACFVGLIVGAGAEALRFMIATVSSWMFSLVDFLDAGWLLLFIPVAGVLLCGIYCRYVVKDDMEFGCQRIRQALDRHDYRMQRHIAYAPIFSCALTLGFGGSAGSEGPIAYAGAGIGSNVGKFFGLSPDMLRILIGCGAGAGIAGIFKAPVGGALFAIEVIGVEFTTLTVFALMVCCVAAWFTSYLFSGMTLDLPVHEWHAFDAGLIPALIMLGLFCGLYSIYYTFAMNRTEAILGKIVNPWVKNIASGLVIGACLFVFPALYGEGYGVAGDVLNGGESGILGRSPFAAIGGDWALILFLAGILLVKSIACASTNAGGGVGGDFAPTMFAGCMAGMLFALFSNLIFHTSLPVADFAFFGMAGVMSGAIRAPMMAMFLAVEMTGDFGMFFPVLVTSLVSFASARLMTRRLGVCVGPSWLHRSVDGIISRF